MAWEISITAEGWQDIRNELDNWSKKDLIQAISDDYYEELEQMGKPDDVCRKRALKLTCKLNLYASRDCLADHAFELIEKNNTCDNGGWAYWIDREGYHKVYLN